ncbi:unnamed protein product [Effrenium voratum]|nr:unnamed protein product [Effrenium voratum]
MQWLWLSRPSRVRAFSSTLWVDGATKGAALLEDVRARTCEDMQPALLQTVGQAGLATCLEMLAQLRYQRSTAVFSLEQADKSEASGPAAEGARGKQFRFSLPSAVQWRSSAAVSSTLQVTEQSSVQGVAKALAARVAELPHRAGPQAIAVHVDVRVARTVRWHRLLKAAYAIARVHEWQVRPSLPKPTRPFSCQAVLLRVDEQGRLMEVEEENFLRLQSAHLLRIKAIPDLQ